MTKIGILENNIKPRQLWFIKNPMKHFRLLFKRTTENSSLRYELRVELLINLCQFIFIRCR